MLDGDVPSIFLSQPLFVTAMSSGGHTTVIQRILERRAQRPPAPDEGTTATVAVMLRVLPPPRALLAFEDTLLKERIERRILPDVFELEEAAPEIGALQRLAIEGALGVARKLRGAVSHAALKVDERNIKVTASFGLCASERIPTGVSQLAERMLKVADLALYRSKRDGRNRITGARVDGDQSAKAERNEPGLRSERNAPE